MAFFFKKKNKSLNSSDVDKIRSGLKPIGQHDSSSYVGKFFDLKKYFIIFLIVLLGVMWGLSGLFSTQNNNNVISGKINLTAKEFYFAYVDRLEHARREGLDLSVVENRRQIAYEVLSNLFDTKILELEIDSLGMDISDEDIANIIRQDKTFCGPDGAFSREIFERFLLRARLSEGEYVKKYKNQILLYQLFFSYCGDVISDEINDTIIKGAGSKRNWVCYVINCDNIRIAPFNEADKLLFYESNKSEFMSQNGVAIRYVFLSNNLMKSHNSNQSGFIANMEDSLFDIADIESEYNVVVNKVDFVSIDGKDKFNNSAIDIRIWDLIKSKVFAQKQPGIIFVSCADGLFIIQIDALHEREILHYDKCKDLVEEKMLESRRIEESNRIADLIKVCLDDGYDIHDEADLNLVLSGDIKKLKKAKVVDGHENNAGHVRDVPKNTVNQKVQKADHADKKTVVSRNMDAIHGHINSELLLASNSVISVKLGYSASPLMYIEENDLLALIQAAAFECNMNGVRVIKYQNKILKNDLNKGKTVNMVRDIKRTGNYIIVMKVVGSSGATLNDSALKSINKSMANFVYNARFAAYMCYLKDKYRLWDNQGGFKVNWYTIDKIVVSGV